VPSPIDEELLPLKMECSNVGRVPPIASGKLHIDEGLVVLGYVLTILLLLFGPASLVRCCRKQDSLPPGGDSQGPWFLDKTVYAPIVGVLYMALINPILGRPSSLITVALIKEVCLAKYDIIVLITVRIMTMSVMTVVREDFALRSILIPPLSHACTTASHLLIFPSVSTSPVSLNTPPMLW